MCEVYVDYSCFLSGIALGALIGMILGIILEKLVKRWF